MGRKALKSGTKGRKHTHADLAPLAGATPIFRFLGILQVGGVCAGDREAVGGGRGSALQPFSQHEEIRDAEKQVTRLSPFINFSLFQSDHTVGQTTFLFSPQGCATSVYLWSECVGSELQGTQSGLRQDCVLFCPCHLLAEWFWAT